MGAYTYSTTAASNTSVDGIGAQGSDSPDNIDNLVRALAASQAALVRDLGGASTSVGGTADAITVSLADPTAATAYFDGMIFAFRVATDSTSTAPTLNVDGIGTKQIKRAIQGVESNLIAGDLQAGQTAIVVYRSAWATAAGAFELLNPSILSAVEIGHATDTTLDRAAAGFLSVEGKRIPSPASQAQYDMLVRGATEWERLAIGTTGQLLVVRSGTPTWSNASTFDTAKSATSTVVDFTGIPSWAREIDIIFRGVSTNGTDNLLVQLGDSGGIENTGYLSQGGSMLNGTGYALVSSTAGFLIGPAIGTSVRSLIFSLKNISNDGIAWVASFSGADTGGQGIFGGGDKALSAALDRVRITTTGGTNTFDAGTINICYR